MPLSGIDPLTGVDCEHRRQWSRDRLEHLASVFAIEVVTYAILGNHTHQILRSRPDIARTWSPEVVATRWLSITPKRKKSGEIIEPTERQIQSITGNPKLVEKLRLQLSDVSWWMRSYAQFIATRANREDDTKGHFWEERFRAIVLYDEASILRCMLYVDLNPIRAGMAKSIEQSDYTGAKDRLDDWRIQVATNLDNGITLSIDSNTAAWERLDHHCSGWLSPIQIDASANELPADKGGVDKSGPGDWPRRVSGRGAVRISLPKYFLLLDLVGRHPKVGGSGFIPADVAPILEQLGIEPTGFIESIWLFGRRLNSRRMEHPTQNIAPRAQRISPVVAL
jgi:hypothetical protein